MQKLNEPINFDTWTERASSAGKLNSNPAGKTPMEKYLSCLGEIKKLEAKDKLIASQIKSLEELRAELPTLKSRKDDIVFGKTTISHLNEVYWRERTGTKKDIHSGYIENGKLAEPAAISLCSQLDDPDMFEMGEEIYSKCDEPRQFNEYFQGECDIHYRPKREVQDTKCCWDIDTYFPHIHELLFSGESDDNGKPKTNWKFIEGEGWVLDSDVIENNDYDCQGQVYLQLYGEEFFKLRYCLVDMPQEVLDQQIKSIIWEYAGHSEEAELAIQEFKKKHIFSDLPINLRVTTFTVKKDEVKYTNLCRRVEKAREYLNWYSQEMFWLENPGMKPMPESLIGNFVTEKLAHVGENPITVSELAPIINNPIVEISEDQAVPTLDIEPDPIPEVIKSEISFIPVEDQIQEEDRIREDLEPEPDNIDAFEGVKSDVFPEVLDTIEPSTDEFELKILALKNLDDLNEFYMENADAIHDTKYEAVFYAHRETLSNKPESPKITKVVPKAKEIEPVKEVVHPSTYIVKDGLGKELTGEISFDSAKIFVLDKITSDLDEVAKLTDHVKIRTGMRDAITVLYQANKQLIERFLSEYESATKVRYDKVIEDQRKAIEEMVKKM